MNDWDEFWSVVFRDRLRLLGMAICLATVVGCNPPVDHPDLIPVTGTVTMDGKPFEGARVSFLPTGDGPSKAVTNANGRYELQFTGEHKGAVAGKHRVMISKTEPDPN